MKIHDSIHSLRATHLYRRYRNDCARTLYGTIFRTVIIILTHRIATTTTTTNRLMCVCAVHTFYYFILWQVWYFDIREYALQICVGYRKSFYKHNNCIYAHMCSNWTRSIYNTLICAHDINDVCVEWSVFFF